MTSAPDLLRRHLLLDGSWLACCTALAGPVRTEPGGAAAAPRLLLANTAPADIDPRGYLVSEKYDGVRAVWDGGALRFRSGRPIAAPESFIRRLPAQPLDGELWLGRRRFDELSGIARADRPDEKAWRDIRYMVFELPEAPGSFAQRAERIDELARRIGSPLQPVDQVLIADRAALQRRFETVLAAGGEGLMLHRADAPYLSGRSDLLLKLKPALDDEAVVIAHLTGRGRHARQLGALEVRTDDGRRFRLGTGFSDAERADPPPIGSRVTFRFRERTPAGIPRFASFVRRHHEL